MSTDLCAWLTSQVGRVIGKNGETIKALQTYTGALIQIDQVRGASLHVVARAKSAWVLFAVLPLVRSQTRLDCTIQHLPEGPAATEHTGAECRVKWTFSVPSFGCRARTPHASPSVGQNRVLDWPSVWSQTSVKARSRGLPCCAS